MTPAPGNRAETAFLYTGRISVKILLLLFLTLSAGCDYYLAGRDERFAQLRRADYVKRHPELADDRKELIVDGTLEPGMSENEVVASWGRHYEKERFTKDGFTGGIWKYWPDPPIAPGRCYFLTFVNGKLQSWYEVKH